MPIIQRKKTGFSLIELSVIIFVLSILVAGSLSILGGSSKINKKLITQERINRIYRAIGTYVSKNYHLPCPAPLSMTMSNSNYAFEGGDPIATSTARTCPGSGIYSSNNVSNITYGMVPVYSLGLSDEMSLDGYGNRLSYVVVDYLTSPNYNDVSALLSEGFSYYKENAAQMIQIYNKKSSKIIKDKVAFVIISHGENGYGAYGPNSTTQNDSSSATVEELHNIVSGISGSKADFGNNSNYSGYVSLSYNDTDSGFDDMVFYKTRDEIINDFKLDFLYFCDSSSSNYDDIYYTPNFNYGYNGQVVYGDGSTTCDYDEFIIPAKRCGLKGTEWIDITTCPEDLIPVS